MNVQIMGVINVTPNSFSDGGLAFNKTGIENRLHTLSSKCDILDFGGESTAPMNSSVGSEAEKERLALLLETFKSTSFLKSYPGKISLDSFRSENALWFFECLKKEGVSSEKFIWNDVSGVWDQSVEDFLKNFSDSLYVFCHNEAGNREESGKHMEKVPNVSNGDLIPYLLDFFSKGFKERVFIDPCFGFSKTYEQNLYLLEHWGSLIPHFSQQGFVFGISKKSFLRRFWQENIASQSDLTREVLLQKSEYLHLLWLKNALLQGENQGLQELVLRVHDPEIGFLAKQRVASS